MLNFEHDEVTRVDVEMVIAVVLLIPDPASRKSGLLVVLVLAVSSSIPLIES